MSDRIYYPDDSPLTGAERKAIRRQGLGIDGPEGWRRRRLRELDDRELPDLLDDPTAYVEDEDCWG